MHEGPGGPSGAEREGVDGDPEEMPQEEVEQRQAEHRAAHVETPDGALHTPQLPAEAPPKEGGE